MSRSVSPDRTDDRPQGALRTRLLALRQDPLLALAVFASLGAGAIHLAIAPEHTSWWLSVVFFLGLGLAQIGSAVYLAARPVRTPIMLGLALLNVGALATWLVSRTTGMPFGPHKGVAEPAARADIVATVLGLTVVLTALAIARHWHPLHRLAQLRPALTTATGATAVSALSLIALTGVSGHAHSVGEEGHSGHTSAVVTSVSGGGSVAAPALSPLALCKREARIENDAAFAKAVVAAKGKAKAIAKADRASRKQLRAALAECAGSPQVAPAPPAPAPAPVKKSDDGHDHSH
ncbi:MAG: hypothetical protein ACT4QF_02820 [Sporichthyaceae bacterium]